MFKDRDYYAWNQPDGTPWLILPDLLVSTLFSMSTIRGITLSEVKERVESSHLWPEVITALELASHRLFGRTHMRFLDLRFIDTQNKTEYPPNMISDAFLALLQDGKAKMAIEVDNPEATNDH